MTPSKAFAPTAVMGIEDFQGQPDTRGQTFTMSGEGQLIDALKCPCCGHSVTATDKLGEQQ
jgi:hypothetical protein